MSSDGPRIEETEEIQEARYRSKRNRLTAGAALISIVMIALSWLGAHYRDSKRTAVPPQIGSKVRADSASRPTAINSAAAALRIDGLPSDAKVSVDSTVISTDSFTPKPGRHQLTVRANGYRDLVKAVDFKQGLNRYQVKLCPLTVEIPVSKPAIPIKTYDLANRVSAWQTCTEITCAVTQADIDRRASQIVAKTCSNWNKASHRRRGRSLSEDGAGLVTEVGCEVSLNSPRCRLKIIKGICVVDAPEATNRETKPFACPPSGAVEFSAVTNVP